MLTGTGRQNHTVKTEGVKGDEVEAKTRSLLKILRLASVWHDDCHFNSQKQVKHPPAPVQCFKKCMEPMS